MDVRLFGAFCGEGLGSIGDGTYPLEIGRWISICFAIFEAISKLTCNPEDVHLCDLAEGAPQRLEAGSAAIVVFYRSLL